MKIRKFKGSAVQSLRTFGRYEFGLILGRMKSLDLIEKTVYDG